ncbi:MAG: 5'-methylthioadenosine/adenosylhomocysteine nucleosidase [Acidimicrobiia bacterium]|nr:5'-methylthioadenosine/adenosylhomocysteine nucleosidase [Acidimicrobiia bacterium]
MTSPIAVLSAMEQEGHLIEARLDELREETSFGRRYVSGLLAGNPIVTAVSGFGKAAAAATVAAVLERYSPSHVVFAGVAGGVGSGVEIGDIVIADRLVQHDFDASPIFQRFVIPSLGVAQIRADEQLTAALTAAAHDYLQGRYRKDMERVELAVFDSVRTRIHTGAVASGDRFVSHEAEARSLVSELPSVLAVEMEGAAVAQVCAEASVPFAVFRSISDRADESADVDFLAFIAEVAAPVTAGIVEQLLRGLR